MNDRTAPLYDRRRRPVPPLPLPTLHLGRATVTDLVAAADRMRAHLAELNGLLAVMTSGLAALDADLERATWTANRRVAEGLI